MEYIAYSAKKPESELMGALPVKQNGGNGVIDY